MRTLRLALLAFGLLPVAFACSSSSSGSSNADDGKGVSLVDDDSKITVTQENGFAGPGPDGSTCSLGAETIGYEVATKTLSWNICEPDAGIQSLVTGSRVLTDDEATSFRTTLGDVTVDTEVVASCSSDAPVLSIAIDGKSYANASDHCHDDGKAYADGIGGVLAAANDLAH